MKSKKIVRDHFQRRLDDGASQKTIALEMAYDNPNNISMMLSEKYPKSLMSPNKIPTLCTVCDLSPREAIAVTFARLDDADGRPIEMSKETLKFLFMQFGRLTIEHFRLKNDGATPC